MRSTSSRNLLALVLVIALAALGTAAAQMYGTVVDGAWYDTLAEAYQNPPAYQADNGNWAVRWSYRDAYPAIEFDIEVTGLNQVEIVPASESSILGPNCSLTSTAALAEHLMRDRVSSLRNLTGPDASEFRESILAMGRQQLVQFRTTRALGGSDWLPAVAVDSNGMRYEPLYFTEAPLQIGTSYSAYFSLAELQERGVIENGTLTIARGISFTSHCRFNLNDLP